MFEHIKKSIWTDWQDRDGIYLALPGSNSVYVGFADQNEAERFAATLESDQWRVRRWGVYKTMSDEEARRDPEVRRKRILYGFGVQPL